jgi:hypothetical protein
MNDLFQPIAVTGDVMVDDLGHGTWGQGESRARKELHMGMPDPALAGG